MELFGLLKQLVELEPGRMIDLGKDLDVIGAIAGRLATGLYRSDAAGLAGLPDPTSTGTPRDRSMTGVRSPWHMPGRITFSTPSETSR